MKSNRFVPWTIAVVSSLVLAGLVTAATLKSQTALLPAGGNDPTDGNITRVTASLLEHSQFSRHRLDDELAAKFLDRYLDSLDPAHLLFLQSDAQQFDGFCSRLSDMTRREGDLAPERTIFQRYLKRLELRDVYVTNLLQSEKFDFTGHDAFSLDRTKALRPLNLDAARELWRQNVRAEYLQEKLAGKKPADIVAALTLRYTRLIAPLPECLQERGLAAPGLSAQVLVSKYCDHLPLYRQEQIYTRRHGVHLPRQTLARWVALAADWLKPIYEQIRTGVMADGYVQVPEGDFLPFRRRGTQHLPRPVQPETACAARRGAGGLRRHPVHGISGMPDLDPGAVRGGNVRHGVAFFTSAIGNPGLKRQLALLKPELVIRESSRRQLAA